MPKDRPRNPETPAGNLLNNGVIGGDPRNAPRCGAKTRRGTVCQQAALRGKRRCRHHGGLSTGPRTPEGRARIAAAATRHGNRSKEAEEHRRALRELLGRVRALLKDSST